MWGVLWEVVRLGARLAALFGLLPAGWLMVLTAAAFFVDVLTGAGAGARAFISGFVGDFAGAIADVFADAFVDDLPDVLAAAFFSAVFLAGEATSVVAGRRLGGLVVSLRGILRVMA